MNTDETVGAATLHNISGQKNPIARDVFIDAGIEHIHVRTYDSSSEDDSETLTHDLVIKNSGNIQKLFRDSGIMDLIGGNEGDGDVSIYITGKLSEIAQGVLQRGEAILPAAALWSAAKFLVESEGDADTETVGIIDLSASGYMVICVDKETQLHDDLLIVNPRCGAGTGVNLSRILEKLDINRDDVDRLLTDYLGEAGRENREQISVRADRCGVFSSSATISDKNQGIPLEHALAVTMKSEVMKPCSKMSHGVDRVYLTGGVFRWQYARDCAEDILKTHGIQEVIFNDDQSMMLMGMKHLVQSVGKEHFREKNPTSLRKQETLLELPSFTTLKDQYERDGVYKRLPDTAIETVSPDVFVDLPVNVGLDIGSTMAKVVITDAKTGALLFQNSYNNHGDTIETVKHIFHKLKSQNIDALKIQNIGITGSGRYQVQKALKAIYPHIEDRIFALVENYAHARGSIQYAKDHIAALKRGGSTNVNEDFYLLIDIGGEDTKISVISLKKEELFDNAMNIKCSAGTGSLMDTLKALFTIDDIADAYGNAFKAEKAYGINATCAVFLMENARKMQAEGYGQDEILASCCYAIVENMARTLWDQVEFPPNTIALLHGQTMLSDPLPLAVTHRAQEYMDTQTFCLVPPFPGHRACFGLIKSIEDKQLPTIEEHCRLDDLIERKFEKRIIICRGAACGDKNARCARTKLTSVDANGRISLTLGGCTAVNELQARKSRNERLEVPDAYKAIWNFIDSRLPKSDESNRLVIPRSFAVSEKAFFLARIFEYLGIPVYVDNVQERDIMEGQPLFTIDTCAPNIGATGQFLRLAREPHGIILAPQIDFLYTEGKNLGRTCTTNQGGILIAHHFANMMYPEARFKLFDLSLDKIDPPYIADQLYRDFQSVFDYYGVTVSKQRFIEAITHAQKEEKNLLAEAADITADFIEEAINKKFNISIVSAREYILNPGIYDSHIGKLLKDRSVVAIPAYIFDIYPDEQFDYIYWKNPYELMTKAHAVANKRLHRILRHPRLRTLIKNIETGTAEILMSLVTVSTFRCGPDSITLPILTEVTKNMPSLLIQSDAMIAELAHLENRVNTHLNQLKKKLHTELSQGDGTKFSIGLLDEFSLDGLYVDTDVVYFPTMADNRAIAAVFRAAGLTVIDNYEDESYDLAEKAKRGRKYVGDSVCVPLAVVFSDMLDATDDFLRRKKAGDPLVEGKERVVLFMHRGDGPCRQGQYIDICKLGFHRMLGNSGNQTPDSPNGSPPIKFLEQVATSLHDEEDYLSKIEKWTTIQGFHALAVSGVLQSLYLKGGALCKNTEEYEQFTREYRALKRAVHEILEYHVKPDRVSRFIVDKIDRTFPKLGGPAQYFGYGLFNNNGLRKILKKFSDTWIRKHEDDASRDQRKIKVHVEGEIYIRNTQVEEIFKSLIDTLGFGAFELTHSTIWCYFEYILESRILIANKTIAMYEDKLTHCEREDEKEELIQAIAEKRRSIKDTTKTINNLRNVLAGPLYKAAGLEIPHSMKKAITAAEQVLPKYKPFGELVPYVGETISQLNEGADLVLNTAPEGCMVASMGEILGLKMMQMVNNGNARIQFLSTTEGEINEDLIQLSLLKILGPEKYYSR